MSIIENTPIWSEVQNIQKSTSDPVKFGFTATIETKDNKLDLLKVKSIDIVRDYVNTMFDRYYLTSVMPLGDYLRKLYPNRTNLELTLNMRILTEVGNATKINSNVETFRFKCLFRQENPNYTSSEYDRLSLFDLNNLDLVDVSFDLLDRGVEPIRALNVNANYRNVTMKDILEGVVIGESQRMLVDGKPAITGADIYEPSNKKKYDNVVIPNRKPLLHVPNYLQSVSPGIYNGGLGSYLQYYNQNKNKGLYWFIYPIYEQKRFYTNITKLSIYAVPKSRLNGIERTYRTESGVVHILASSEKQYSDSAQNDYIDRGSGFFLTDANAMLKKPVDITEKGPVGSSSRLNYNIGIIDKEDGFNYSPNADKPISSNPFAAASDVLQRAGGRVDVIWQNSNPYLLYPGMPVKYYYLEGDTMKMKAGVLSYNHTYIQTDSHELFSTSHLMTTSLVIYVW